MEMKPIKTKAAYKEALKEITTLLNVPPGSPEADRLEVLSILVEAYEDEHHPVVPPNPIEAIKFRLEQQGISITRP